MPTFDIRRVWQARDLDELRDAYDATSGDYDHHVTGELGWLGPDLIADEIAARLPREEPILDAGAGTGLVGAALAQRGFTAIDGNDIAPRMLELAREKGVYRDLREATLGEPLPYADDSYGAVTAAGVFLGNPAPPDAFRDLVRIVRPGGFIVFNLRAEADPSAESVWSLEDYERRIDAYGAEGLWRVAHKGPAVCMLPKGEPDALHRVWVLEIRAAGDPGAG